MVIHINSEFYDVAAFEAGKSSLNEIELNALENIKAIKISEIKRIKIYPLSCIDF